MKLSLDLYRGASKAERKALHAEKMRNKAARRERTHKERMAWLERNPPHQTYQHKGRIWPEAKTASAWNDCKRKRRARA